MRKINVLILGIVFAILIISCDNFLDGSKNELSQNKQFNITYEMNGGVWKSKFKAPEFYTEGEKISLPNSDNIERIGYDFIGWFERKDFSGNAVKFISADTSGEKTFYAKWKAVEYTIKYDLEAGNWISGYAVPSSYNIESEIILPSIQQINRDGYVFCGWYEDSDFCGMPITSIKKGTFGNKKYFAKWEKLLPVSYSIVISSEIKNGIVCADKSSAIAGEIVHLSATAADGYVFESWSVIDSDGLLVNLEDDSFVMPENSVTVSAEFIKKSYRINISCLGNGTVSSSHAMAVSGTTVTLRINSLEGYRLDQLSVMSGETSVSLSGDGNTRTFIMPNHDVTIDAAFVAIAYLIRIADGIEHGTLTPVVTTSTFGEWIRIKVTPNEGYSSYSFTVIAEDESVVESKYDGNDIMVKMPASNITVATKFELKRYSVIIPSFQHGYVTSSVSEAAVGTEVTLFVSANQEYKLEKITVVAGNASVPIREDSSSVIFEMPASDVIINAVFGINYTPLSIGLNGKIETDATYVTFGEFPQTLKKEGVIVDESEYKIVGEFTYYRGSDNAWYVKSAETAYKENSVYSDGTLVGQNGSLENGKWFKVEPIKWKIITKNYNKTGRKLLVAENVLINCSYYDYKYTRSFAEPNNYKYSRIRAYLNGTVYKIKESIKTDSKENTEFENKGFLYSAFSEDERSVIAVTTVINNARSTWPDDSYEIDEYYFSKCFNSGNNSFTCEDTEDQIFLLSEQEVTNSDFGFSPCDAEGLGNSRIRLITDFARARGCAAYSETRFEGYWWLRSPDGQQYDSAWWITAEGGAISPYYVTATYRGVVPALCLK